MDGETALAAPLHLSLRQPARRNLRLHVNSFNQEFELRVKYQLDLLRSNSYTKVSLGQTLEASVHSAKLKYNAGKGEVCLLGFRNMKSVESSL